MSLLLPPLARPTCRCAHPTSLPGGDRPSALPSRSISTSRPIFQQAAEALEQELPVDEEEESAVTGVPFASLENKIHPQTLATLTGPPFNFKNMSSVQARVLSLLPELVGEQEPHGEEGGKRDLLVKARTGTGKTIAFLTPALESRLQLLARNSEDRDLAYNQVGTLIISPTRELAAQIAKEASALTSKHGMADGVHLWLGGEDKRRAIQKFQRGRKDFVVATPGRLKDMMQNTRGIAESMANLQTVSSSLFGAVS